MGFYREEDLELYHEYEPRKFQVGEQIKIKGKGNSKPDGSGYVVYGIGWIPSKQERENSDLQYIPIPGLSYTVRVVYDPLRLLSPELKRYLELLKEEIRAVDL